MSIYLSRALLPGYSCLPAVYGRAGLGDLTLLQMGFSRLRTLLPERRFLTPSFHPCRQAAVLFLLHFPYQPGFPADPGYYPASCPVESGLSSEL